MKGSPKELVPGFENFVPAIANHFCVALAATFSKPGVDSFGDPARSDRRKSQENTYQQT